jgi:vacuolar-type H+-ATPase subunit E/Vma4
MGLDQVIGEVRRAGEERGQAIVDAARKEAATILDAARAESRKYEDARVAAAAKDAAQLATQAGSRADSDARKAVLAGDAHMRAELKAAVLHALAELPAKTRAAHVKALVESAQGVIPAGKVYGAKKDAEHLAKAKPYTHGGDAPITGGIVVESEKGDARLDLSYETILDDHWRELLKAEAALFQ